MSSPILSLLTGDILEEDVELTLADLCKASHMPAETVYEFIEYGVIEPLQAQSDNLRFQGTSLFRIKRAKRLQRDLGVNLAGAALALDLMEKIEDLEVQIKRLQQLR
ncbi:chaperone modulator CbpM [methane-oxidizing endosymbiont of Gigantopelta aegis]|uniref:chaperone modulator CbpM n=1 Tax=methane-oxidizing endosymbiont of Gigantopelta aegis TaxID=2794938 RepID=UPI001FDA47D9|nr:chaperone modulator CbpM [methane-oxidizing endosymbiont of Gigantopelta aegis]